MDIDFRRLPCAPPAPDESSPRYSEVPCAPFFPEASSSAAADAAIPTQIVCISAFTYCIVS